MKKNKKETLPVTNEDTNEPKGNVKLERGIETLLNDSATICN